MTRKRISELGKRYSLVGAAISAVLCLGFVILGEGCSLTEAPSPVVSHAISTGGTAITAITAAREAGELTPERFEEILRAFVATMSQPPPSTDSQGPPLWYQLLQLLMLGAGTALSGGVVGRVTANRAVRKKLGDLPLPAPTRGPA